jgi:hypothetical protein
MSWELGGDFMSGMADSIRERRAREVPERKEGVVEDETTFEEKWPEDEEWEEEEEWEDEEEEWEDEEWEVSEKPTLFERVSGLLIGFIDFIADVATLATVPAALLLLVTAYQTTFGILETALFALGRNSSDLDDRQRQDAVAPETPTPLTALSPTPTP